MSAGTQTLVANPMTKAADRAGAYSNGVANSTVLGNFTIAATSKVNVLPTECHGRFVRMYGTAAFDYYFTQNGSAVIAVAPAATDAGARDETQGEPVSASTYHEVVVPWPTSGASVYLARIATDGATTGSLRVTLADGTIGVTDGG
jgi:hypothetical protein